jgi:GTP-binding protein HflX
VVDISHPNFEDHMNTVNETLKELGAIDKEIITVFNKIDAYQNLEKEDDEPVTLADFEQSWMAKNSSQALFISATKKENLEQFRTLLYDRVKTIHTQRYPFDKLLY